MQMPVIAEWWQLKAAFRRSFAALRHMQVGISDFLSPRAFRYCLQRSAQGQELRKQVLLVTAQ